MECRRQKVLENEKDRTEKKEDEIERRNEW